MNIDNEIWFQKIIKHPSKYSIFQCKKTKIEIPFDINETKIREYNTTQFPKWIDGEKYHIISRRSWGLGKNVCLYIDDIGDSFVIESKP